MDKLIPNCSNTSIEVMKIDLSSFKYISLNMGIKKSFNNIGMVVYNQLYHLSKLTTWPSSIVRIKALGPLFCELLGSYVSSC